MSISTPSRDAWREQWQRAQPDLEQISSLLQSSTPAPSRNGGSLNVRLPPPTVLRSTQVDAHRIDSELTLLLKEQFIRIFNRFNPSLIGKIQPELAMILDFLIFRYSIWEGRPLPGMSLMNLRFENSGKSSMCADKDNNAVLSATQKSLYCVGAVFLRYFWSRGMSMLATGRGPAILVQRESVWRALRSAESAYRIASLINFLAFLRTGRYRNLLERMIGARLVYTQPSATRAVSYEYLNRQLVWSEISDVLLFLLPLVNVAAVKRAVRRLLPNTHHIIPGSAMFRPDTNQSVEDEPNTHCRPMSCSICGVDDILLPYAANPCNHVFCYYCLRGHTAADPGFECPLCLTRIEGMRPKHNRI